jgi:hypothetical protein
MASPFPRWHDRPRSVRLLVASLALVVVVLALDCVWQRVFIPRLMGLQGRYYSNDAREGEAALTATDSDIATETLNRRRRQIHADAFSVAWTGEIEIPAPGEHTFFARSGGPLALLVDGAPVVESRSGGEATGTIQVSAGLHEVLVLYSQGSGEARLALDWARDRQPREPLSGEHFLPPRPDWPAIEAYRAGRTVLRWLLAASVLIAIAAMIAAAATRGARMVRAEPGRAVAAGCLVALVVTGGFVLDDFGVPLDENSPQREIGILNHLYLSQGATRLFDRDFPERHFGPAVEVLLVVIEKQLGLADSRAVFLARHGATFLLFCLGVVFFYRLGLRQFGSRPTALFGCCCLVLSPRIFADSFYNSKDIPALSLFVISIYTLVRFLDEGTARRAFWHALSSALLIDTRIVGVVVPAMTLLLATGDLLFVENEGRPRGRRVAMLALYGALLGGLVFAFYPFLWRSPLEHLVALFGRIPFTRTVRYLGQDLPAAALPWHYLPVWIGVTTPLAYLALFGVGLLTAAGSCLTTPARLLGQRETRNRLVWVLWGLLPLVSVVATKALVYDGWRHVYFVYPGLVMIAVEGACRIAEWVRGRLPVGRGRLAGALAAAACLLVFAEPLLFMTRYHPYGNVFFNRLAGDGMRTVRDRFEVDYWGLSYRRGLEYVLRHDRRPTVRVLLKPGIGEVSAAILPSADRKRLAFVDRGRDAEYYLGNYRWHRGEYPYTHEVFSVRVGDASIMTVYDLRFDRW